MGFDGMPRSRESVVAGNSPGDVGWVDGVREELFPVLEVVYLGQGGEGGENVLLCQSEGHGDGGDVRGFLAREWREEGPDRGVVRMEAYL